MVKIGAQVNSTGMGLQGELLAAAGLAGVFCGVLGDTITGSNGGGGGALTDVGGAAVAGVGAAWSMRARLRGRRGGEKGSDTAGAAVAAFLRFLLRRLPVDHTPSSSSLQERIDKPRKEKQIKGKKKKKEEEEKKRSEEEQRERERERERERSTEEPQKEKSCSFCPSVVVRLQISLAFSYINIYISLRLLFIVKLPVPGHRLKWRAHLGLFPGYPPRFCSLCRLFARLQADNNNNNNINL